MDTLRGNFADRADLFDDTQGYDAHEDEAEREGPPAAIGQDERRMQVRAYNHWASLLDDNNFPSIDDLDPDALPDFGPYSVLLDFTAGVENPGISYLGEHLAKECGTDDEISRLSDVPARSLLSRITDHYMQILANQAPIGFEAEFVNQRSETILYRGILLPFSSDDDTIDFIYGVINWKEIADQKTTDELMLEIDQALDDEPEPAPKRIDDVPMTDWADGPVSHDEIPAPSIDGVVNLASKGKASGPLEGDLPAPSFGHDGPELTLSAEQIVPAGEPDEPAEAELSPQDVASMGLGDWLAAAREMAEAARAGEDRTRAALYAAIGRAYDFSLAANEEPDEFAELVSGAGLTMQDRAPMTPVVKLVFGADYDKTRLTEYAAALGHARRISLERGSLEAFLRDAEGGLKGVVKEERRLRREEAGKPAAPATEPRARIAKGLRKIEPQGFEAISGEGHEFGLVMIRRMPGGAVAVLGEVSEDIALVERAAKRLLG